MIPKETIFDEITDLLKKCRDIIDDDLENRAARHSLGNLHARLIAMLARIKGT